jgi:hypothetical protein
MLANQPCNELAFTNISSSGALVFLVASARYRGPSLGCRADIRTRACLTASRRALWTTPHPTEPRRTLIKLSLLPKETRVIWFQRMPLIITVVVLHPQLIPVADQQSS